MLTDGAEIHPSAGVSWRGDVDGCTYKRISSRKWFRQRSFDGQVSIADHMME